MKAKSLRSKTCKYCKKEFETYYGNAIYCSRMCNTRALQKVKQPIENIRKCKVCNKEFYVVGYQRNKQHCSEDCARVSACASRKNFHKRNPKARLKYDKTRVHTHGPDTLINRFFQKYPHIERKCRICGEDRVLDLHHIEPRRGAWRRMSNITPETILVLCPTCHALIERNVRTLEELGLVYNQKTNR
jgi:hypothetical protein